MEKDYFENSPFGDKCKNKDMRLKTTGKVIFKTDVAAIKKISNRLRIHQKSNYTQVNLGDINKSKIYSITNLLNQAANLLETIK
jgi:hypothetical protein